MATSSRRDEVSEGSVKSKSQLGKYCVAADRKMLVAKTTCALKEYRCMVFQRTKDRCDDHGLNLSKNTD